MTPFTGSKSGAASPPVGVQYLSLEIKLPWRILGIVFNRPTFLFIVIRQGATTLYSFTSEIFKTPRKIISPRRPPCHCGGMVANAALLVKLGTLPYPGWTAKQRLLTTFSSSLNSLLITACNAPSSSSRGSAPIGRGCNAYSIYFAHVASSLAACKVRACPLCGQLFNDAFPTSGSPSSRRDRHTDPLDLPYPSSDASAAWRKCGNLRHISEQLPIILLISYTIYPVSSLSDYQYDR